MGSNKLTVNPTKSKYFNVNPKLRDQHTCLLPSYDNCGINCSNHLKYLGIDLDKQLSFSPLISKIELKLSRNVDILTKLGHCLPTSALLTLYYAFIFLHILYGIVLWSFACSSHLHKMLIIQNKALRAICSLNWRDHVTPCSYRLSILKINDVCFLT